MSPGLEDVVEILLLADGDSARINAAVAYVEKMHRDRIAQDREIGRLREALRVNMLRLAPNASHADIDRVLMGTSLTEAA